MKTCFAILSLFVCLACSAADAPKSAISKQDKKAAEKEFKEIYGSHNQDLAALAKLALANQYRNSGRDAEAIALYKQLIEHPTRSVGKAEVQFEMAALYKSKQPAEAKKIYEQIRKDNPAGPAAEMASAQLQDMK